MKEYKAGKVEFRNDATGIVHAVAGKLSFDAKQLIENIQAFIDHIHAPQAFGREGALRQGDLGQRHDEPGNSHRGLSGLVRTRSPTDNDEQLTAHDTAKRIASK